MVYVDDSTALEIVCRLNIEKDLVSPTEDFDGVFPKWAVQRADKIKNNTWKMPVEVGFRYLIRLHFKNAGVGGENFKILINKMIAHTNTETVRGKDQDSFLLYRDYMVVMRGHKQNGRRDISISLQSFDELADGHGILAGFEIVKLSNPDDSLASPNPLPPPQDSRSHTIRNLLSVLGHRNASATFAITVISLLSIIVHKFREIWEARSTDGEHKPSANAERHCRRFSLAEIQLATRNFNDGLLIGRGGFGKVYKGLINNGQKTVAAKRLKSNSRQGAHEFLTEIETLSELRHMNLVSLIGYCSGRGEMILVYEYMACGTLADHLYKLGREGSYRFPLTWKQRLNICIGAARGLDYLHTSHRVIHRDVKASNILLDENFVAKVSDFGLAKPEDRSKLQSHVSTKVKGTFGYLDPYYFSTQKLTKKSDTYAFGVVLLEALCGRPAIDSLVLEDERILTKWARDKISKGEVDQIVDFTLREEISVNSLKVFVEIADRCLHEEPKKRPTNAQVVVRLDYALEQQESNRNFVLNETASVSDDIRPTSIDGVDQSSTSQITMSTTDMQNISLTSNQQINNNVVTAELTSGDKRRRKPARNKRWRIWPWDTLWNRKPSKNSEEEIFEADIKLAKFDWDKIAVATNDFSSSNKSGIARSSTVYKAVLPTRQVVAVRVFSQYSRQGLNVFKNEIALLTKLRHPNVIRLLGYCVHREGKLLIYELMENSSLDTLIGATSNCIQWPLRFKIIMGIARGLVYLHLGSGLGVIHTDLKLSNILLDSEMNPKISDFGLFQSTMVDYLPESVSSCTLIGGFRHMSPEFFMEGKISVKSDVYSFGLIVLQLVSGRRAILSAPELISLPRYAGKLWSEGKALDLVDDSLAGAFPLDEALKCIQVGLLCIEKEEHQRPEMYCVFKMLEGDEPLQEPQSPWPPPLGEDSTHSVDGVDSTATFELDDTGKIEKDGKHSNFA